MCFCDDGWGTSDCSVKLNLTRIIMSVDSATVPTTSTTTTESVRVIPVVVSKTAEPPTSTEMESSAVVQGNLGVVGWKKWGLHLENMSVK